MGVGISMLVHADVYFDSFTYTSLLFSRDEITIMMVWSLILKLVCERLVILYYASFFKLHKFTSIASSTLYTFYDCSMIIDFNLVIKTIDKRLTPISHHTILTKHDVKINYSKNMPYNVEDSSLCKLDKFSANHLFFTIDAPSHWRYVAFSMPYDIGWEIDIDGT